MRISIPVVRFQHDGVGTDARPLREFEAVLIQPRPFRHLADAAIALLGLAVASASAQAQTLWETAPARPAPLPTLVTTNPQSSIPSQNVFAVAQSGGRPQERPVRRLVAIPPPPAGAMPGKLQAQPQPLSSAADPPSAAATNNLNNLPSQGTLSGIELPDPPSILASDPLNLPSATANLPPLPNFADLPAPPTDLPDFGNLATTAPVGPRLPAESPFRQASVDAQQAAGAFGLEQTKPQEPTLILFQPGELVAVVGTEHILAGDMHVFIQPIIEQNRDKIGGAPQEAALRAQLTRQVLPQYIEVKAMYLEFFRDMVGSASPKEFETTRKQVVTKAGKIFFEKQVPNLLKKYDAKDLQELESKLRDKSMSLRALQSQFIEQVLSGQVEQKYIPEEYEIDRDDIIHYYQEHRENWEVPAKARWRQLTARFDKYPTRTEAQQAIQTMGNEIYLGGKSFEAVAKQSSQGFTADQGGVFDWTSQGSLKSRQLDEAIFTLAPRKLSQIIEDDLGYHIIEILEREAAHTEDLAVSQSEIRKTLSRKKRDEATEQLRERIMKRTPIWTRWPEDIPGSRPLSNAIGELEPKAP